MEKSDFVYELNNFYIFVHPLYETLWYAGFRTVFFVLVVPSKLSWGSTSEVFVSQNGLNILHPGSEQLWEKKKKWDSKLPSIATVLLWFRDYVFPVLDTLSGNI